MSKDILVVVGDAIIRLEDGKFLTDLTSLRGEVDGHQIPKFLAMLASTSATIHKNRDTARACASLREKFPNPDTSLPIPYRDK